MKTKKKSTSKTRSIQLGRESKSEFTCRAAYKIAQGAEVDPAAVGVKLIGPATWKDGSPVKLVWIQVAETGHWKGHGAGEFEMTSKTFDEIVTNFAARGLPIPIDMEHASEQDATSGSIPITGAPAQGWLHRLDNRGPAGLWALAEFFDYLRDGIKAGQFAFVSPAVRFGARDAVSGKDIGARLTSLAATNAPFLTGLPALVAASDKAPTIATHKANVMACLTAHANCSAKECTDLHAATHALCAYLDDDEGGDSGDTAMHLTIAQGEAAKATLLLAERDQTIATQLSELTALRADKAKRDDAETVQAAENAFFTYRDARKLTEAQKPLMLKFARADRAAFDAMYPPVRVDHMYLMRDLVPPPPRELPEPTPAERVRQTMREDDITYVEASLRATGARGHSIAGTQSDLAAIKKVMRDEKLSYTEIQLANATGRSPR
jgi:phage I-like protein